MRQITKNTADLVEGQIGRILTERGFYDFVDRSRRINSIGNFISGYSIPVIVAFRLLVLLYYYPRSIQYFLKHPIEELGYFVGGSTVYFGIAVCICFGVGIITSIIRELLANRAKHIYYQTYNEFGIEAPEFEI